MELDTVSVHTSVVFTATIVFVTSEVTITIPADARTRAQIAPGIRYTALTIARDLVVGISVLMVDIISIRREAYATNP